MTQFQSNRRQFGFTLIELMVVVVVSSILLAIAIPSYQSYVRKGQLAQAQQEILKLADQLERHKAKNFSYKGFDISHFYKDQADVVSASVDVTKQTLQLPLNVSDPNYELSVVGFYSVNEFKEDEDGNKTAQGMQVKTGLLTTSVNFDSSTMQDLFAVGNQWAIKAESKKVGNYSVLMNSQGMRCMNKENLTKVTYTSCGTADEGAESW